MTRTATRTTAPRTVLAAAALLAALTGCAGAPAPQAGPAPQADARDVATPPAELSVAQQQALAVAERFTEAANRGDEAGVRDAYAPEARFDSVGRIYPDREAILERFLIPEVLRAGGTYQALSAVPGAGERVVVEYEFTTSRGGREHFTYDYLVTDGTIRDVIGRYV
ncbi:hypothetical protein ACU61A_17300 [Pseudonocardia sichuanensis]